METKNQSVFMQMHNGTRTNEGSFNVGLQKLFYLAAQSNRVKLVSAFPEFFGNEVPEFGIYKTVAENKTFKYKGWLCEWNKDTSMYSLYTPEELEQPKGFREPDTECSLNSAKNT
ncbi:MAG: hypothetical protein VB066_01890 [Paludibacter sp.]|nr:hypothetical protein [Paludibacter sp.]